MTAPYDFTTVALEFLARDQREPDGKLHPSTHLINPLRHTQLDLAGAPRMDNAFGNKMRLITGTLIHEWIHDNLRRTGLPHMPEVNLEPWLPDGWKGTADCFPWNAEHQAFGLQDYKTKDGKGLGYVARYGASKSHVWQASSYLYAGEAMGIPIFTDFIEIVYIPITEDSQNLPGTHTAIVERVKPIDKDVLHEEMLQIKHRVDQYLASISTVPWMVYGGIVNIDDYLTDALAEPPAREQKLFWNPGKKVWDVKLVPPWEAKYCPFKAPLCTCHEHPGTEKIGEYDLSGQYTPRSGYEEVTPTVAPKIKKD